MFGAAQKTYLIDKLEITFIFLLFGFDGNRWHQHTHQPQKGCNQNKALHIYREFKNFSVSIISLFLLSLLPRYIVFKSKFQHTNTRQFSWVLKKIDFPLSLLHLENNTPFLGGCGTKIPLKIPATRVRCFSVFRNKQLQTRWKVLMPPTMNGELSFFYEFSTVVGKHPKVEQPGIGTVGWFCIVCEVSYSCFLLVLEYGSGELIVVFYLFWLMFYFLFVKQ